MFRISILVSLVLVCFSGFGQEKDFRLSLQIGAIPSIWSFNSEAAFGALNQRLAFQGEIGYYTSKVNDISFSVLYLSVGPNYYFNNNDKGLYGHVGFGAVGLDMTLEDNLGRATGEVTTLLFTPKLGYKLGKGTFFGRFELGYSFFGESTIDFRYNNSSLTTTENLPYRGGVFASVGVGLAF